ncbi:putative ribonuclease H-like domain-containing protein [Tanacetum coccineum]
MRMEQYLTHTDYALWEVIVNGDAPGLSASHLLKFHGIKDAKTLWEAIKTRFGSNKESKKMQKTILKLAIIENFYDRVLKDWIKPMIADLDGLSIDDLYNNLKVYEAEIKSQSSSSLNSQNVAFVSLDDTSSTNEAVNTDHDVPTARKGHVARECREPRNQGNRNRDAPRRIVPVETPVNALVVQDGIGSFSSSSSDSEVRDTSITELKNQLAEALKEKDDLKLKLEKFETSSMKLTKLINSQINVNNKSGFSFDSQMNENELHDCHLNKSEVFESASDSIVNEIEEENNLVNDRFKKVEGYHAVPPPYTGNYMPSRPDLSFAGLDDSVYKTNVSETISSMPRIESTASKSSKDSLEHPKDVRPSAPIIKEWQAENLRKSQSPRVDKRNWNGIMTQKLGNGFEFNKKAYFVCGSLNHLIKGCNFYKNKMVGKFVLNNMRRITGQREVRPIWNNPQRVNHQNKLTHPHPKRNFVPTAVLTMLGNVPVNTAKQSSPRAAVSNSIARYVNTAAFRPTVNGAKPSSNVFHKSHSSVKRTFYQRTTPKTLIFKKIKVNNVTTARTKAVVSAVQGHETNAVKSSECWIWIPTGNVIYHISKDSGSYMLKRFDYVDLQGRLKSTIAWINKILMVDLLHLEEVLKEFNLFSVSQICDKKNSVLFTKAECLILSPDFKLLDESQVLLKIPRQNNMYSFDLKNGVPSGGLTCLFSKATIDESNLWHRWLGHINFKTMNKLVRGNLIRGLPLKIFENDHTCVACQKGKQHKASCKTKLVSSISQPLQMFHMDLFGPTFVKSLNKKMYCLVVTDDFSRCDNGTEFKNSEMNQFCEMKGIKREFSVARTPQQNGVAERKNRTLIEAARTMLADSLLPTTFWAEAINTACYVQNRVLITKPHNKTPYELLIGRPPNLDFMRPFGCPVTILNTLDHLGKFEGKADEGFLVGYSVNRSGPEWLFDIDSLTKSMNYEPVTAGNQTNDDVGIETNINARQAKQEKASDHEYILLPFMPSNSSLASSNQNSEYKDVNNEPGKGNEGLDQEMTDSSTQDINTAGPSITTASTNINIGSLNINTVSSNDLSMPSLEETGIFDGAYDDEDVGVEADINNLETTINVSPIPTTIIHKDHPKYQIIGDLNLSTQTRRMINFSEENAMVSYINKQRRTNHKHYQNCLFAYFLSQQEPKKVIQALTDSSWIEAMQEELLQFKLQKVWILVDLPKGKRAIGTKWVYRNKKDEREIVVRNKARLVAQGRNGFIWDAIKALEPGMRPCLPTYWKIDLEEVYVDDIIFGSTKKSLCDEFGGIMTIQIQDEFYGGTHFLLRIATSTLIETNKALIKDEEAKYVDVNLYRSMIGSLMYLTTSRPDIMFAVCACARFQVTPNTSHLHVVKRIFRYLKGQPKLGLWYPKDSPLDLEAFSDSNYARASLDKKSTTRGCQFLSKRLISWQCKKQTIFANSTTEAEYVVDRQNSMVEFGEMRQLEVLRYAFTKNPIIYVSLIKKFWHTATVRTVDNGEQEINVTVDGKEFTITEASVMRHLQFAELLVTERYETTSLEGYDLLLWGDLKTLFESYKEDEVWRNQQGYNLISLRLFDAFGVHVLLMDNGIAIHMMIEKKYPFTQETLSRMINRRLEVDHESEMAFELLRFTRSQLKK